MSIKFINRRSNKKSEVNNNLKKFKRLATNTNLSIYDHTAYMGLNVMEDEGPFIEEYLDKLYKIMHTAVNHHPRTLAIRFELNFPVGYSLPVSNEIISKFVKSMKYRICLDRARARSAGRAHNTGIHYVWAKETAGSCFPHYHVLLLLSNDAYKGFGCFKSRTSLYGLLRKAWAVALGLSWGESKGLVHASRNKKYKGPATYCINFANQEGYSVFERVFKRSSYLCKARTKVYQDRLRSFGSSQI